MVLERQPAVFRLCELVGGALIKDMCESLRFVELGEDGGKKTRATVWILRERTA